MARRDDHRPLGPFEQLNRSLSESMLGKEGAERARENAAKNRKRVRRVALAHVVIGIFFRIVWGLFLLSCMGAVTIVLWHWALH